MRPPAHLPSGKQARSRRDHEGRLAHSVALSRTQSHSVALSRTQSHSVAISRTQSHSVARAPLEAVLDALVGAQDELEPISRAKGAYAVGREGDRIGTCGERVQGAVRSTCMQA